MKLETFDGCRNLVQDLAAVPDGSSGHRDCFSHWHSSTHLCALYPCSIKTREALGNPSLMPKRFPETRERVEGVDLPMNPEFWPFLFIINPSLGSALDRQNANKKWNLCINVNQNVHHSASYNLVSPHTLTLSASIVCFLFASLRPIVHRVKIFLASLCFFLKIAPSISPQIMMVGSKHCCAAPKLSGHAVTSVCRFCTQHTFNCSCSILYIICSICIMHYIQSSVPKNMKDCSTSQLICEKFIVASNVGCCHPMAMSMAALDGSKYALLIPLVIVHVSAFITSRKESEAATLWPLDDLTTC